jgi:hypothetical protein
MGDWVMGDKVLGDKVLGDKTVYAAGAPPSKVVLLLSANVDEHRPLGLDREHRAVVAAVRDAGRRIDVRIADAVQLTDLQPSLQEYRPAIAHFSGHGSAGYGITVTDGSGRPRAVPPDALSDLFRILRQDLLCVVLNACFTAEQARLIGKHIPCVIGMRGGILDDAAIDFSAAFYRSIAYGQTLGEAFELGRNQLRLKSHRDAGRPQLIAAPGAAGLRVIGRSYR